MNILKKYKLRLSLITLKEVASTAKNISIKTGKKYLYLFFDIIFCCIRFGATTEDYDKLGFALLKNDKRSTYITTGINNEIIAANNDCELETIFSNIVDFKFYYDEFINRKWIDIEKADKEKFSDFVRENKPVVLRSGNTKVSFDVRIMDLSQENDYYSLHNRLVDDGHNIIEQYISAHKLLEEYSPKTLNRLKITTYLKNNVVYILRTMLYLDASALPNGDGNSLFVFVGNDGVTKTEAINSEFKVFEINPSTNSPFKGFKVPGYKKATALVSKAALIHPDVRFVEWTVGITDYSVELIDGSIKPSLMQTTADLTRGENGILSEYRKYISI